MSETRFTGFWERRRGMSDQREWLIDVAEPGEVATTLGPVEVDDLLDRVRRRLLECQPGDNVRIDLIAWDQGY
jgi:hypothetical protein